MNYSVKRSDKTSIRMPSGKEFIGNRNVSDRVYAWILLNCKQDEEGRYIESNPKKAYSKIGMNYRTFYSKFYKLETEGYLKEEEGRYRILEGHKKYTRYIYKDTLKKLLDTRIDNIIKIYIEIGSIYDTVKKSGGVPFFRYSDICKRLGYYEKRDSRNVAKIKEITNKLKELGLVYYREETKKVGDNYQINCIISGVNKKVGGGEK